MMKYICVIFLLVSKMFAEDQGGFEVTYKVKSFDELHIASEAVDVVLLSSFDSMKNRIYHNPQFTTFELFEKTLPHIRNLDCNKIEVMVEVFPSAISYNGKTRSYKFSKKVNSLTKLTFYKNGGIQLTYKAFSFKKGEDVGIVLPDSSSKL